MTIRTNELGDFVFARSRRVGFQRALIALLIITGLLLYVGGKVKIVRLGYQLEVLEREKQELERANRSLLIESSSLSSPARIEEIAIRQLGMVRPAKGNIVMVKRKNAANQ